MGLARWIARWAASRLRHPSRARIRADRRRLPTRQGLGLDRLESRELRAADRFDVAMLAASTPDSRSVDLQYEVRGLAEGQRRAIDFGIYRSADAQHDPARDRRVGSVRVVVEGDGSAVLSESASVGIPGGLRPTPARPYVLAVADPSKALNEADTSNNVASFRKHTLGVVTHGGIQVSSAPPPWAAQLSEALRDVGYDAVFTFTWAAESRTPGAAPKQGARLANMVLHASALFPEDEPVDLHLIGHSQGAVVNSRALLVLDRITTPQLASGYTKATMLDPHAANNGAPGQGSYTSDLQGWVSRLATTTYQGMAADPLVTIPDSVHEAEVYYQHTPVALSGRADSSNLWGQAPLDGQAQYSNLTGPGMAHSGITGVQSWYYLNVVPTLAEGAPFVNPTEMTGRLIASPTDRTSGDLTRTATTSPTYAGTAAPGGTIRLITQTVPGGPLHLLGETTAAEDGSWSITTDELPRGHYRMIARGIVPAGVGPWEELYPLLPLGRLAVRPAWDQVKPERLDRIERFGTTEPPPIRRTVDGPKGLPIPSSAPSTVSASASASDLPSSRSDQPPRTFELSPGRERLIARMAERLLTDRRRSESRPES